LRAIKGRRKADGIEALDDARWVTETASPF
jgi:hypothetical protein